MATQSENSAVASELPGYKRNAENAERSERSNGQSESRDRKAVCALILQNACNAVLQRVKSNNIVANSNWPAPLAAAPSAISTVAILLKTAEMKAAAGLEIESQEVKDDRGQYQRKAAVSWLAFLDAQHSMNNIRGTARGMIAEEGTIAYNIDLLEDPEDARYNLKPEIKAIRDSARKCLENAQAVTPKFQYWHLVICHLRQTSLSKCGEIIKEKEDTDTKKIGAEADEVKSERNVERAQVEVDRLRYDPIMPELSVWEEIELVRRLIPTNIEPPKKERGAWFDFKDAVIGKSAKREAEDEAIAKAHAIHVQKLTDDAMAKAREQRDYQRKLAADHLDKAREDERKTAEELTTAIQELQGQSGKNKGRAKTIE
ncbi:MAG: hypothetical protein MMC33_009909 [Icmadophila ericetorum]|nr:hypothetical protein [Icmadophila ericetorum]